MLKLCLLFNMDGMHRVGVTSFIYDWSKEDVCFGIICATRDPLSAKLRMHLC